MQKHFVVVVFLLVVAFHFGDSWKNEFDELLNFNCPTGQSISYIRSIHSNYYEDRRWDFRCRETPRALTSCEYSGYVNSFDGPMAFQCQDNGYIAGVESVHHNYYEDRKYNFYCCQSAARIDRCYSTGYSSYDQEITQTVPHGYIWRGVSSRHDNYYDYHTFDYCIMSADKEWISLKQRLESWIQKKDPHIAVLYLPKASKNNPYPQVQAVVPPRLTSFIYDEAIRKTFVDCCYSSLGVTLAIAKPTRLKDDMPIIDDDVLNAGMHWKRAKLSDLVKMYMVKTKRMVSGYWGKEDFKPEFWPESLDFRPPTTNAAVPVKILNRTEMDSVLQSYIQWRQREEDMDIETTDIPMDTDSSPDSSYPPPTDVQTNAPPTDGQTDASPTDRHTDSSPTDGQTYSSPTDGQTDTLITDGHTDASPTTRHTDSSPTDRQTDTPITGGHTEASQTERHTDSYTTDGHTDSSPNDGQTDTPMTDRHADSSPTDTQTDTPITDGHTDPSGSSSTTGLQKYLYNIIESRGKFPDRLLSACEGYKLTTKTFLSMRDKFADEIIDAFMLSMLKNEKSEFEYIPCAVIHLLFSRKQQQLLNDFEISSPNAIGVYNRGRRHWLVIVINFSTKSLVVMDPLGELHDHLQFLLSSWLMAIIDDSGLYFT